MLAAASLLLAGLACQVNLGGPQPTSGDLPNTLPPPTDLADTWRAAIAADPLDGQISLIISERELTTFLATRLAEADDPVLREPQVRLETGEVQVYGLASAGPVEARALLSIEPTVSADGSLMLVVSSAQLGPLPVPDRIKQALSDVLTEAFTGTIGSVATGIRITSLAIADGEAAIVGELR